MSSTTREIWVTQHERDNLRPDYQNLPHEEINILSDGGNFRWPYCHDDREGNPDAVVSADTARICPTTIPPALKMQAHSAPLGITFLDRATQFPADYRGDALVALHGSWNRSVPVGAMIVRLHIANGKPTGYEEFIKGWQDETAAAAGRAVRWGRPADVLVYKDGFPDWQKRRGAVRAGGQP